MADVLLRSLRHARCARGYREWLDAHRGAGEGYRARGGREPGLAFDLAKTLVESVCRSRPQGALSRLQPRRRPSRLFKTATNTLPFLPAQASGEGEIRRSLAQTLNGLHTAIQGICELRNQCGFASHGSANPRPAMESVQAFLAAGGSRCYCGDSCIVSIVRIERFR